MYVFSMTCMEYSFFLFLWNGLLGKNIIEKMSFTNCKTIIKIPPYNSKCIHSTFSPAEKSWMHYIILSFYRYYWTSIKCVDDYRTIIYFLIWQFSVNYNTIKLVLWLATQKPANVGITHKQMYLFIFLQTKTVVFLLDTFVITQLKIRCHFDTICVDEPKRGIIIILL